MPATIRIPTSLRGLTEGSSEVEVNMKQSQKGLYSILHCYLKEVGGYVPAPTEHDQAPLFCGSG